MNVYLLYFESIEVLRNCCYLNLNGNNRENRRDVW